MSVGMPRTLFDLLYEQYGAFLRQGGLSEDQLATHQVHLSAFRKWADAYLSQCRPVAIEHGYDSNYLVTLASQGGPGGPMQQVLISPPLPAGLMASSGRAVGISSPAARGGPQGVVNSEYVPIGGEVVEARPAAPYAQQGLADRTIPEGPVDLTKPGNQWPR